MRTAILVIHICAGVVGLVSGTAAMSFRKGSRRHGLSGSVFVVAMLIMGSTASYLSVLKGQSGLGGIFGVIKPTPGRRTASAGIP